MIDSYLKQLKRVIFQHLKSYPIKVYLFGSRATGKEHALSDIDIAIEPLKPLPVHVLSELREKIENSTIPYSVDLVDLTQVNAAFRKKILAEAIEWKD